MEQVQKLHGFHQTKEQRDAERKQEAQEKKAAQLDKLDEKKLQAEFDALQRASFLAPHQKERKMKVEGWLHALRKRREAAEGEEGAASAKQADAAANEFLNSGKRPRSQENDADDDDDDVFGERRGRLLAELNSKLSQSTGVGRGGAGGTSEVADDAGWDAVLSSSAASAFPSRVIVPTDVGASTASSSSGTLFSSTKKVTATSFVPRNLLEKQRQAMSAQQRETLIPARNEGNGGDDGGQQPSVVDVAASAKAAEQMILEAAAKAGDEWETLDDIFDSFA